MQQFAQDIGWIEVICGSMFSGKTEELIRRLKRAIYGKQTVQVFKPQIDNRYDPQAVVSHSQRTIPASAAGPPKSVSTGCWRGLTALALVGGNGSPPCPKSQAPQLISLIPTT